MELVTLVLAKNIIDILWLGHSPLLGLDTSVGRQSMKGNVYIAAIVAFIIGGGMTFAVVRELGKGSPELAFVVGAILGTQIAAVVHRRDAQAESSPGVKATIGMALAGSAILLGVVLQFFWMPFEYPEISLPISVVGAFIFPFVLFETMWDALSRKG